MFGRSVRDFRLAGVCWLSTLLSRHRRPFDATMKLLALLAAIIILPLLAAGGLALRGDGLSDALIPRQISVTFLDTLA